MQLTQVILICLVVVGIAYSEQYYETFSENLFDPFSRNAVKSSQYKWPNGVIPYVFSGDYCRFYF